MERIDWLTSLGYAEDSAIATRKPILLYFYEEGCISCAHMESGTFCEDDVVDAIRNNLIALRLHMSKKSYYEKYHVIWAPTLLLLDFHGNEIQRNVGYLSGEDFIPFMHLGIAKVHLNTNHYDTAGVHLNQVFSQFPESSAVPEALFFRGVNLFRMKNDPGQLKNAYETLRRDYPDSSWTRRAKPYRRI